MRQTPDEGSAMNYAEAVKDPATTLGRMATRSEVERAERIAAAKRLSAAEEITLTEALKRMWSA